MRTKLGSVAAIAAFSLALGWVVSPYVAAYQMKQAIRDKDAIALSEHIDFPALRDSIKGHFTLRMAEVSKEETGLAAGLGVLMQGAMNTYIDAFISPEGLAKAFSDAKVKGDLDKVTFGLKETSKTRLSYETPNRFSIGVAENESGTNDIVYVLRRSGLFGWRLSSVRMSLS